MGIFHINKWFTFEVKYYRDGRKAIDGSWFPFGSRWPWVTVYIFGLLIRLKTQFLRGERRHRKA